MQGWKKQLSSTPLLLFLIVLISIGVGTASALITITLAGNVIVTDNLSVGGDVSVNGTITGALNIYTIESPDIVINSGQFKNQFVSCNDNNDIAIDGSFNVKAGDSTSFDVINSEINQAFFDSDFLLQWVNAAYVVGFHNTAAGSLTMQSKIICLEVPGVLPVPPT